MSTYLYREDSGYGERFEAADDVAARKYARELLEGGDYGVITKTTRISAQVARIEREDGEEHEAGWRTVTADLQPAEPACTDPAGHDWDEGPSYGSGGGGVRFASTCRHCGLQMITDTGDTDHATGAVMETTEYVTAGA